MTQAMGRLPTGAGGNVKSTSATSHARGVLARVCAPVIHMPLEVDADEGMECRPLVNVSYNRLDKVTIGAMTPKSLRLLAKHEVRARVRHGSAGDDQVPVTPRDHAVALEAQCSEKMTTVTAGTACVCCALVRDRPLPNPCGCDCGCGCAGALELRTDNAGLREFVCTVGDQELVLARVPSNGEDDPLVSTTVACEAGPETAAVSVALATKDEDVDMDAVPAMGASEAGTAGPGGPELEPPVRCRTCDSDVRAAREIVEKWRHDKKLKQGQLTYVDGRGDGRGVCGCTRVCKRVCTLHDKGGLADPLLVAAASSRLQADRVRRGRQGLGVLAVPML